MTSHFPANSFSNETNTNQLDAVTETETSFPHQCVLDESVQTHMYLIGSILAQIIRDWSAEQQAQLVQETEGKSIQ